MCQTPSVFKQVHYLSIQVTIIKFDGIEVGNKCNILAHLGILDKKEGVIVVDSNVSPQLKTDDPEIFCLTILKSKLQYL